MTLIGVDGCRFGWVAASADASEWPRLGGFALLERFWELLDSLAARPAIIAVDMPIGLAANAPRRCDLEARRLLGPPRGSCVFPAPCRAALAAADDYRQACELNRQASQRALSRQCFGILPKVKQIEHVLTPERQSWIREAHPEVTFAVLSAEGRGLAASKKTRLGRDERLRLLGELAAGVDLLAQRARLGRANVAQDDLVDALACLATAQRICSGAARSLPTGDPEYDQRGLRMEIVAERLSCGAYPRSAGRSCRRGLRGWPRSRPRPSGPARG